MKAVRYRTESFGGSGERDAAEVMAFETFTLGNVDILQTLAEGILKGRGDVSNRCWDFIDELNNNGYVDDMGIYDQIEFMKEILSEIEKVTGIEVKYALWLADKDVVTDRKIYGRHVDGDEDFECYEIGPVVLSELGCSGTLYGYPEMPISLEDKVLELQDEMTNIINEREDDDIDYRRALWLDERYLEVDGLIQEIEAVLSQKTETAPSLDQHVTKAEALNIAMPGSVESKADLYER